MYYEYSVSLGTLWNPNLKWWFLKSFWVSSDSCAFYDSFGSNDNLAID